jgi:hypothetical protein
LKSAGSSSRLLFTIYNGRSRHFDGESLGARADGGAAMLLSDPSVLNVHADWMVVCSAGSLWFIREAYCVYELGRPD